MPLKVIIKKKNVHAFLLPSFGYFISLHFLFLIFKFQETKVAKICAAGLEYLHCGCKPAVIHRDLKTANILLDHRLRAKLADFGISRIFSTESATHISTDHVAGTPGYLAPE